MTFYTGSNNIFYLELAIDRTEFIKIYDFEPHAAPDPDELIAHANNTAKTDAPRPTLPNNSDNDDLLKSLGM